MKLLREFACLVAGMGALSLAAAPKPAFQVYGVREMAAKDFRGTLKEAAALGYRGVETGRFYGLSAKELKAVCDETGLELVALQLYPYNLTEPQLDETIRFCRDCGCRRINVAWYKGSGENINDWQLMVNVLNHAAEVCEKAGIRVSYHNHDHEFSMMNGGRRIWDWLWSEHPPKLDDRQVVDMVPFSSKVGLEFDPANCALGGADPVRELRRLPRRGECMHVTMNVKADWASILAESKAEWLIVKPTVGTDSPAELERCLKAIAAGVKPEPVARATDSGSGVCEVCVVGAGPAGIAAALSAARSGAKTVLIERGFQVGGNLTTGGVNWPGLFHAWGRQIIDGCGWELVTNTIAEAGGTLPDFTKTPPKLEHWRHQLRVDIPLFVLLAEEKLAQAGVTVRYHTEPMSAKAMPEGWEIVLVSGGRPERLRAKAVVDTTGNGAFAELAGAKLMRAGKERQPGGFTYLLDPGTDISGLDMAALEAARKQAVADGKLEPTDIARGVAFLLRESVAMLENFRRGPDHGTTIANYVPGADNSSAAARTETNMRGRASLLRVYRFLRAQKGLENLRIVNMAPEVGVRETCRVEGDYVLTGEDYVTGRRFDDAVAYSFYPIDLHDAEKGIAPKALKAGTVPSIPLGSLTVKGCRNLLVAGRCLSSDRVANSALRVQASAMATGQAAGVAAAMAARSGREVRTLDLVELRARLTSVGAIVPSL